MEKPIHIVSVEAQDFHRLSVAEVKYVPEKGLVRITGKNRAGKTSLLRAIMAALGGAGSVSPDTVREGSDGGSVTVKLSNGYTVRRRVTESNPKGYLTVEGPDGGKHKQSKLNEWLGERSFDPLSFFSVRPERQRDVLLSIGTEPDLPKKLEALRVDHDRLYAERTPFISQKRRARQVPLPDGKRPEPVDTSKETQRLAELQRKNRERGTREQEWRQAQSDVEDQEARIRGTEKQLEALALEVARAQTDLANTQRQRERLLKAMSVCEKAYDETPDVGPEIDEVMERIAATDAVTERLEPWKAYDRAQAERKEAERQVTKLTGKLATQDEKIASLVESAGIPVEGLSFNLETGDVLLNGLSLAVASGRERIDMAVAVALAADPDLRICLLDEANDLDLEAMEALGKLAEAHDFQIWCVRLGLEGPGEITVEDGVARTATSGVR